MPTGCTDTPLGAICKCPLGTHMESRLVATPTPPTIGRIVHYYATPAQPPCAAVVTGLDPHEPKTPGRVDLFVMPPGLQPYVLKDVDFAPEPAHGRWSWPQRV